MSSLRSPPVLTTCDGQCAPSPLFEPYMGWDIRLPHFEGIIFHFSIIFKPVSIDIPLGLYVKKRSTIKNFTLFPKLTEIERKIRSGENIFQKSLEDNNIFRKKYTQKGPLLPIQEKGAEKNARQKAPSSQG